jgi:hypothetical protein
MLSKHDVRQLKEICEQLQAIIDFPPDVKSRCTCFENCTDHGVATDKATLNIVHYRVKRYLNTWIMPDLYDLIKRHSRK